MSNPYKEAWFCPECYYLKTLWLAKQKTVCTKCGFIPTEDKSYMWKAFRTVGKFRPWWVIWDRSYRLEFKEKSN